MRDAIRLKHYSYRTEESYLSWAKRFTLFHNKRHPKEMGAVEIEAFLTHLAVEQHVAASTQNQAFCSLLFLYRHVLKRELNISIDAVRAKTSHYLPTVMTPEENTAVIHHLSSVYQISAKILYGSTLLRVIIFRFFAKSPE